MSDVSGIPNLGFGGGNFFAPQFSYNPQINPTAGYAAPAAYAQSVFNNAMADTRYDQQLFQHYYEASLMGVANTPAPAAPGTFSDYNAGGDWPGNRGGGASSYQTTPDAWSTGASPFQGGGGSSGMGGSIYDSGGFGGGNQPSYGGYGGDAFGGGRNDPFPGMSMPGGLGMPASSPSGASPLDWTKLWDGGGARTDPAPGMKMPGGLGSPMTVPETQVSSPNVAPAPQSYDQMRQAFQDLGTAAAGPPGVPAAMPDMQRLLGYTPDVSPASASKSQDQAPFDFSGSNAGWGNAPSTAMPSSQALLGYEPQNIPNTTIDWSLFQSPANDYTTFQSGGTSQGPQADAAGGGLSAADLVEQARGRLAQLMAPDAKAEIPPPDTPPVVASDEKVPLPAARPAEADAADPYAALPGAVPLPAERPAAADAPRPQVALGTTTDELGYLPGRSAQDLKGVNPRFAKALQEYAKEYNSSQDQYDLVLRSGQLGRTKGEHAGGNAVDINLIDRRNGERLTDYQTRDPVVFKAYQDNANQFHQFLQQNYPDLAEVHRWGGYFSGPAGVYGAQDIMHHDIGGARHGMAGGSWNQGLGQSQADLFELPTGGGIKNPYPQFNFDWSNAPIPDVGPMPLTYKSPGGGSVYQYDPATGQKVNVPLTWDARKGESSMGELSSRGFVPAAPIGGTEGPVQQDLNAPRPPADIPVNDVRSDVIAPPAEPVPLPAARPNAAANLAQANSVLDSRIADLVQKQSPADVSRIPASIASQTLREALGNAMTGGMIRSNIGPYLPQLGITQADFNKAVAQGQLAQPPRFGPEEASPPQAGAGTKSPDFWDVPAPGMPNYNAEVYEPWSSAMVMRRPENQTVGGAGSYADFTPSGNVEDRRTEVLGRDQLAALKARGFGYMQEPEPAGTATNPLSAALGLGNLPVPTGATAGGMARPGSIAGDAGNAFDSVPLPAATSSEPAFDRPDMTDFTGTPFGSTRFNPGDLTQRQLGDPFNPENYNMIDQAYDLATARAPFAAQLSSNADLKNTLKALAVSEIGRDRPDEQYAAFIESVLNQAAARHTDALAPRYQVNDLGAFLRSGYYQPVNQGTMGSSYQHLADNPDVSANLDNIIGQVAYGGSNVSNLATQNSSYDRTYPEFGPGALLPQYGGDYGLFLPGSNEYLTSKTNPANDPRATSYIGQGMQDAYRAFYQQMMPSDVVPWRGR